jgi:pantetheine-phosphate adenylyltransferase
MKVGLYAGSFDPWSVGHQYVLENALSIFDSIHIVVAVNPVKHSRLDAETRARLVAHAIDSYKDWWKVRLPLIAGKKVTVVPYDGLIADYAKEHSIQHLIRGLRSTTDFEAEFNLYFANQAINSSLQTWAIMCPPRLLHCSSTYIRAVVGKPGIKFVGTSFTAQAIMLNQPRIIGQLFDLILISTDEKIKIQNFDENLQLQFSNLMQKPIKVEKKSLKQVENLLQKSPSRSFHQKDYSDLLSKLLPSNKFLL